MAFFSWSRWLRSLWRPQTRPIQTRRDKTARTALEVEHLEARLAPANFIWTGNGSNINWSNPANWSAGIAPTGKSGTDDLVFGVGAKVQLTNNDLPDGSVFNSISISATGYTLKGHALVLGGTLTQPGGATGQLNVNAGAQSELIQLNMTLGGAGSGQQTFTIGQTADLTISGVLDSAAGTPGWTKQGTGLLVLSGKNPALSEAFTVAQGPVEVMGSNPLGSSTVAVQQNAQLQLGVIGTFTNALTLSGFGTVNDGALLDVAGNNLLTGSITLDNDVYLGANAGTQLTIQGPTGPGGTKPAISDRGAGYAVTKVGAGQLIFNAPNSYRGVTTVNNGLLTVEDPHALGNSSTYTNQTIVNTSLTGVGTLQLDNRDPTRPGFVVANELLTLNGFGFGGGRGALENVEGNNTWSGNVTLGSPPPTGFAEAIGVDSVGVGAAAVPTNLLISGVVGDPAFGGHFPLTKIGTGRLILTANNRYNAGTIVSAGFLNVEDSRALGPVNGSAIAAASWSAAAGGTVTITTALAHGLVAGQVVHIDAMTPSGYNGDYIIKSVADATHFTYTLTANPGAATVFGTATVTANLGVTVAVGASLELQLQGDNLRGDSGITALDNLIPVLAPDSLTGSVNRMVLNDNLGLNGTGVGGVGLAGSGALHSISGTNTWTGSFGISTAAVGVDADPNQNPTQNYLANDYSLTVSQVITGGNLIKADPGNLILPEFNIYTGWTHVGGGWLTVENSHALGAFSATTAISAFSNGATLPAATINVGSTGGFPSSGSFQVVIGNNTVTVNYTGTTPTSFTGCTGGVGTLLAGQIVSSLNPQLPQTLHPYTTVTDGAAVMLTPYLAGTYLSLPYNFNIAGLGVSHNDFLINQGGAIENLDSTNFLTGIIQVQGTAKTSGAGIGVEQVFQLTPLDPIPSQLTLTGPLWDSQPVAANVPNSLAAFGGAGFPALSGGVTKLGSQRLIIQGPGTFTGDNDVRSGALLLQNNTGLGKGTFVNALGASVPTKTSVEAGASLELANSVNNQNGGLAGGVSIFGEQLILNGFGDESVGAVAITYAGTGYTSVPQVQFTGGGGTGAAGTALVKNGQVIGVQMTSFGTGYTSAPTVTLVGGGFATQATALANLPLGDLGPITVLTTANAGNGTFTNPGTGPFNDPIFTTDNLWAGPITLASTSNFDVQANGRLVVTGSISDLPTPVLNASELGTTVTITAANSYTVGQVITVTGVAPAGYSGTFVVTAATPTQFTYADVAGLGNATVSVNAVATASSTLNLVDLGEVDLYGVNSYSGTTNVQKGILSIGGNQALGATGTASVQVLTLTSPVATVTQFTLQFGPNATDVTTPITYSGFAATDTQAITSALLALPKIAGAVDLGGKVTVTEPTPGVFVVNFGGSLIGFAQPQLGVNVTSAAGSGTAAVTVLSPGGGGTVVSSNASLQLAGSVTIPGEPLVVTGNGDQQAPSVPTQWFPVGPAPIANGQTAAGNSPVTGRVTGVVTDPNDPNIIYIATAGGGAWKTIDHGNSWHQIFDSIPAIQTVTVTADGTQFTLNFTGPDATGTVVTDTTAPITYSQTNPDLTAAAIQAALNDPTMMKNIGGVGALVTVTQAANGPNTTVFTVTFQGSLSGINVNPLGSIVTGGTGTVVVNTTELGASPNFAMYIGAIAMDPFNSNVLYLGTGEGNVTYDAFYGTGVYKTSDGGVTWSQMLDNISAKGSPAVTYNPFAGKSINAIAIDPGSPKTLYVADADTNAGVNNIQLIPFGTYTLSFIGPDITGKLVTDTTPIVSGPVAIKAALDALSNIGGVGGYVNVFGTPFGIEVEFSGGVGRKDQELLYLNGNPVFQASVVVEGGRPQVVNGSVGLAATATTLDTHAGIWRYSVTAPAPTDLSRSEVDTWFCMTDVTSGLRSSINSSGIIPLTPGPDDDFRITFPYFPNPFTGTPGDSFANWSDVKVVDVGVRDDGAAPGSFPVVYAALGTSGASEDIANAVYRCEDPTSLTPDWLIGDQGVPVNQVDSITLVNPAGVGGSFRVILPGPASGTQANGSVSPLLANGNWTVTIPGYNSGANPPTDLSGPIQKAINSLPYVTAAGGSPGAPLVLVNLASTSSTTQTYNFTFVGAFGLSPRPEVAIGDATNAFTSVSWGVVTPGGGADTQNKFGIEFPSWTIHNPPAGTPVHHVGNIKIDVVKESSPFINTLDNVVVVASVSDEAGNSLGVYTSNNTLANTDAQPNPGGTTGGGGHSWALTKAQPASDYLNGEGNYANAIWAGGSVNMLGGPLAQHVYNNNIASINIFVGGSTNSALTLASQVYFSGNGGTAGWTDVSLNGGDSPHTAQHTFYVDGQGDLLAGNDGGIFELSNTLIGSNTWSDLNGDLAISQINGIAPNPNNVNDFIAGIQSNGVAQFVNSRTWNMVDDTEIAMPTPDTGLMGGGAVYIDSQNANNRYAVEKELDGGSVIRRSTDGGKTWSTILISHDENIPTILDPLNPKRLVVGAGLNAFNGSTLSDPISGGNFGALIETTTAANGAPVWFDLSRFLPAMAGGVTALGLAQYQGNFVADGGFPDVTDQGSNTYDPNTIYVTDGSTIQVTKDHGIKWVNLTAAANFTGGVSPFANVTSLIVDPTNRDTVYAIQTAFSGQPVGSASQVWMFSDATGGKWVEVGNALGLPDVPVWSFVVDPRNGNLYAGTDTGVYQLPNGSAAVQQLATQTAGGQAITVTQRWQPFGVGMPKVQVHNLVLNQTTNTLLAGTYGRSVFELFLNAQETASYVNTTDTVSTPVKAGVIALSGTAEWTGPVIFAGDPASNTVVLGAQGNSAVQNPVATAQLNILGTISDAPGQAPGNPTFIKNGLGNIILSGPNLYGGITDIWQGALVANNLQALGGTANGTLVDPHDNNGLPIATGSALLLESSVDAEPLSLKGDGPNFQAQGGTSGPGGFNGHNTGALESVANNNLYFGPITLATNTTIGVDSRSTLTIIGGIGDGGAGNSLTKELTGTLVLDEPSQNRNSYTGVTFVDEGALQLAGSYAFSASSSIVVLDGAQVQLQSPTAPFYANIVPQQVDPNYNQPVNGYGTLDLSGTGINSTGALVDTSSNGGTDFWNGNLVLDSQPGFAPITEPLGAVSIGVINPLDFLSIGQLAVAGVGIISDPTSAAKPQPALGSGLSIVGNGTVVLTQSDTYTGTTYVSAGATLRLQNPQALGGAANAAGGSQIQNETQRLTIFDPSGAAALGSFQLSYNGGNFSPLLKSSVSPAALQSAIVKLLQTAFPTLGVSASDVSVTQGTVTTPQPGSTAPSPTLSETIFAVVFDGVLQGMNLSNLVVNAIGGATVVVSSVADGGIGALVQNGGTLALDLNGAAQQVVSGVAVQLNGLGTKSVAIQAPAAGQPAASETGTTVTVNARNTFIVGQPVTVAGLDQPGYNGTFTITAATATTFSYTGATGLLAANATLVAGNGGLFAVATSTDNGALENVSGNNTWTGPLDAATLQGGLKGTAQIPPAVTLNSPAGIAIQHDGIGVDTGTSLAIQADPTGTPAIAGLTTAALDKVGGGTLFLPTVNSYQGTSYVNNGIVDVSASDPTNLHLSSLGAPLSDEQQTLTVNGSINSFFQLSLDGTTFTPPISADYTTTAGPPSQMYTQLTAALNNLLGAGNTAVVQNGNVFTISFTGTLQAAKQNVFTVQVNAAGTFIVPAETITGGLGGTTVNLGGTLRLSGGTDFVPVKAGNPGEVLTLNGFGFDPGAGTGPLGALDGNPNTNASNTWDTPIVLASNSAIGAEQDPNAITPALIIDKTISETPAASGQQLTKLGQGTLQFTGSNNNTYTGLTTVIAGTLALNKPSTFLAIPADLKVVGTPGSPFTTMAQLLQSGQFTTGATVTVVGTNGLFDVNNQSTTIGTLATVDGAAQTGNAGTLILANGMNLVGGVLHTNTGGIVILEGIAQGTSDALTGPGVIDGTGTFSLGGANRTFNVKRGPGTSDMLFKMPITGDKASGLVKAGNGILQLKADNTATLPSISTVVGGELQVDGKLNDVALNGGGVSGLGQVGNITGNASTAGGLPNGLISPGDNGATNPAGILQTNAPATGETWGGQTTLNLNLNKPAGASPVAGTDYDQLLVNGNLSLGGAGSGGSNGGAKLDGLVGANVSLNTDFTVVQATPGGVITGRFSEPYGEDAATGDGITFINGVKFLVQYQSDNVQLIRVKENTTMSLTSSVKGSTTVYGQPISFTANLIAEAGAGKLPTTDSVHFVLTAQNGTTLDTQDVTVDASGNATYTPQTNKTYGAGSYVVTASLNPDPNFSTPPAQSLNWTVNADATTLQMSVSPLTPVYGQTVTVTVTVLPVAPGDQTNGAHRPSSPSPNVQLTVNGQVQTPLKSLDASGATQFTFTANALGGFSIFANYAGDGDFLSSTNSSTPSSVTAVQDSTSITLLANPTSPALVGQAVNFTAVLLTTAPGTATPASNDSISFTDVKPNGQVVSLGSAPVQFVFDPVLKASVYEAQLPKPVTTLVLGNHRITASFGGDTLLQGSTATIPYAINTIPTTMSIGTSVNPATLNQQVLFTALLNPNGQTGPGSGPISGVVDFYDGSVSPALLLGATSVSTVSGQAQATFTDSTLAIGNHSIYATYLGNSNYAATTSTNTIVESVLYGDSTTLSASLNPATYGQTINFVATVAPAPGTPGVAGLPQGVVDFYDGPTPLALSVPVAPDGTATFSTSSLASPLTIGAHAMIANYRSTNQFIATQGTLTENVSSATTTVLSTSSNPAGLGLPLVLSATVTAVNPGTGVPLGSVNFFDAGTLLGSGNVDSVSGLATYTTTTLGLGTHPLTAKYAPANPNAYTPSTGNAISEVVIYADTTTLVSSLNPAPVGGSVTFTATVKANSNTPPGFNPTGTVSFFDGASTTPLNGSPLALRPDGTVTFQTSGLAAGTHSITAVYAGNVNFISTTSPAVAQSVLNTTTTSLSTSNNNPVFSAPYTLTVTVNPTLAGMPTVTGTVTVYDGGTTPIGTGTLVNGSYSFTPPPLSVGAHRLTAVYATSSYYTSTSLAVPESVQIASSSTTISSSSALSAGTPTSVYTEPVTFYAQVTPQAPAQAIPTGTVTFFDDMGTGPVAIGTGTINASTGVAAFTPTKPLAVGLHSVSATYNGNPLSFIGSSSTALQQQVNADSTTTTLAPLANTVYGQPVTFKATVAAVFPGTGVPVGGTVNFYDNSSFIGTGTVDASGNATFTPAAPPTVGPHSISASLVPVSDANNNTIFYGSTTSAATSFQVSPDGTTTTLALVNSPSVYGQAVQLKATVAAQAPGSASASGVPGTVVFFDDTGSGPVQIGSTGLTNGVATFTTLSPLPVGANSITAQYVASTSYTSSTSAAQTQSVTKATTGITVASSANPAVYSQAITFTATVTATGLGGGVPSGTVTFLDGNTPIGTGTLNGSGQATFTPPAPLTLGTHLITASYATTSNYQGSSSNTVNQQVGQDGTSVVVNASANPAVYSQPVTFTAVVTPAGLGSSIPLGTQVTFKDGTLTLGIGVVGFNSVNHDYEATFTTNTLAVSPSASAPHRITASFPASANYTASTSPILGEVITQATTTTTLSSSTAFDGTEYTSVYGQSVILTAAVSVVNGTGIPLGMVTFYDATNPAAKITLGTVSVSTLTGRATLVPKSLSLGTHGPIQAVFTPVSRINFTGSTSNTITQVVSKDTVTVNITPSANPSVIGQSMTLTIQIAPDAPGGGIPIGAVTVINTTTGQQINPPTTKAGSNADWALSGGKVVVTVPKSGPQALAFGTNTISVQYHGDSNFIANSGSIDQSALNASKTTLSVTPLSSFEGDIVTLTATITALVNPSTSATPDDGTLVNFYDNGNLIGAAAMSNGSVMLQTASLSVGSHNLTAVFPGDTNYALSTSAAVLAKVYTAPASLAVTYTTPTNTSSPFTVTAKLLDGNGAPITQTTGHATISILSAPPGGVLLGKTSVSYVGGRFSFTGLYVTQGGPYTLEVSFDGLTFDFTFTTKSGRVH